MDDKNAENSGNNSGRFQAGNEYRFQPGQSGNPGGRPKKTLLSDVHDEMLEEKLTDPEFRRQFKEAQWQKLLAKGVVSAMTLDQVWERTEGKVAQPVRISGDLTVSLADEMRKARERAEQE